jgi:hypothetical protein
VIKNHQFLLVQDVSNGLLQSGHSQKSPPGTPSRHEETNDAQSDILPLIVFFIVRDPVDILSVGGVVTTVHTPVVVFLTLYLNRVQLP